MAEAVVKLGSRGQIFIPAELRRNLHWKLGSRLRVIQTGKELKLQAVDRESQADSEQLFKDWLDNPVEVESTDSLKEHDLASSPNLDAVSK